MGRPKQKYKVREHQLYTVRPGVWRQLKRENTVDRTYRFRSRRITWLSRMFVPAYALQDVIFNKRIRKISFKDHPPLFILGLWRSGSTHLHYLMACDPQFGYLKNHQAFTFNMSLLSKDRLNRILNVFVPGGRPQDNIKLTLDDPAEEEQPFSTMSARSSIHSFFFPRNQSYFRKYHLFQQISEKEKVAWQEDYLHLLREISYYTGKKDLLLKNPHNTGRVKELLELFPDARFIFLHRDPYTVFQSTVKLYNRMINSQFLQFIGQQEIQNIILENNALIMQKYRVEREMIPQGNLLELAFDELEKDPMSAIDRIYKELNLEGLDEARPRMEAYLASVKTYRKNTYLDLSPELVKEINLRWEPWFRDFGYPERPTIP